MHVLLTGAGGFNGRRLVDALLADGHVVSALVGREQRGSVLAARPNLEFLWGDLAESAVLPPRVDAVVHAAARSWEPGVTTESMVRDNASATARLAAYAAGAGTRAVVYFSSVSVHGRISAPEVDENTPIVDPDVYGMTKLLGESLLAERAGDFASLAIRLPGVLGRGSVRNWLTRVVDAAKNRRPVSYFNPDAPFNNAVHVDDLAAFVVGVLKREWQGADAVCLGAAKAVPLRRVVESVYGAFGDPGLARIVPPVKTAFTISSAKAAARYGYRPADTADILARFVAENRS